MPQQLDKDAVNLAKSIRKIESNDNFTARGQSGEFGAYQFTKPTWDAYSREAGLNIPLEQATPEQQNQVAYTKIKQWKDQGRNVGEVASMWNAGPGKANAYQTGHSGINSQGVSYDTGAYARKVAQNYQQLKAQSGQIGTYAPPQMPTPSQPVSPSAQGQDKSIIQKGLEFLFPILEKKERTGLQTVGDAALSALWFVPFGGVARGIGMGAKALGAGAKLAKTAGLVGTGASIGYGADVASDLSEGRTDAGVLAPGIGTATGGALGSASGAISKLTSKILPRTSGVPEQAFSAMRANPSKVTGLIKAGASPETARETAVTAVKQLRSQLSNQWKERTTGIINEFQGGRVNLGSMSKKLQTLSDEFAIDLPQNLNNVSAKEGIDLLTKVNEILNKGSNKLSPKGHIVREVKDALSKDFRNAFGGENGSFATLYKDYSARSDILKAADKIVNAYKTNNPKAITTAQNDLRKIFNEDRGAYLKAIQDLEQATGVDILSQIAASKFQPILPMDGIRGLDLSDILKWLAFPLTSPRMSGAIDRTLSGQTSTKAGGLLRLGGVQSSTLPIRESARQFAE